MKDFPGIQIQHVFNIRTCGESSVPLACKDHGPHIIVLFPFVKEQPELPEQLPVQRIDPILCYLW